MLVKESYMNIHYWEVDLPKPVYLHEKPFTFLISENTSPCNTHIILADNLNPFFQFFTVVAWKVFLKVSCTEMI